MGLESRAHDVRRDEIKKGFKVRLPTIDKDVAALRAQLAAEKAAAVAPPTLEELAEIAEEIIEQKNVLALFLGESDRGITGEDTLRQMLYLTATSRLFDKPMHLAVKGPSSAGKSVTRDYVLKFFPPEDVISFTSLSEKALYYFEDDFVHKVLSMGEAGNPEEQTFQDRIMRQLMSEGVLHYPVVQKQVDGSFKTVVIEKNGPVVFLVTTTHNKLHPENETRMLSIEVDDSAKQTKKVLLKVAEIQGLRQSGAPVLLEVWHAYQRWLAAGPTEVYVGFAKVLAREIENMNSVRLRRDWSQLLTCIMAHALLHREHRKQTADGLIVATIKDDYAAIRPLIADLMATASELKIRKAVEQTVTVVEELMEELVIARAGGVTVQIVKAKLKLNQSSALRRLKQAVEAGLLRNTEDRKGYPGRYVPTEEKPSVSELLPTVKELEAAWAEWRRRKPEK